MPALAADFHFGFAGVPCRRGVGGSEMAQAARGRGVLPSFETRHRSCLASAAYACVIDFAARQQRWNALIKWNAPGGQRTF
jgi:hypothetical protein